MAVKEYQVGPITLYYATRRFAHERIAKQAWEEIDKRTAGKGFDLGVYRHGPSTHPGRMVTALSLLPEGVEKADWIMRRGQEVDIYDDGDMSVEELEAMAARRARMVIEHSRSGGSETHVTIRHPDDGMQLHRDGTMGEEE